MMVQARTEALLVGNDAFFNSRIEQLIALAARHAIATMYTFREFVVAGGLISYGSSLIETYRQVGLYTGRKGARHIDWAPAGLNRPGHGNCAYNYYKNSSEPSTGKLPMKSRPRASTPTTVK